MNIQKTVLNNRPVTKMTLGDKNTRIDVYMGGHVDEKDLVLSSVDSLSFPLFSWRRDDLSTGKDQIIGIGEFEGVEILFSLTYPTGMNVYQALKSIEEYEKCVVPVSYTTAFLIVDKALVRFYKGEVPEVYMAYTVALACESTTGLDRVLSLTRKRNPDLHKQKLLNKQQITQSLEGFEVGYLNGSKLIPIHPVSVTEHIKPVSFSPIDKETGYGLYSHEIFELVFPYITSCRPLDVARWIDVVSSYLWSNSWWEGSIVYEFAQSANTPLVALLNAMAMVGCFRRKPVFSYKGFEFSFGLPEDQIVEVGGGIKDENLQKVMLASFNAWLQLVELYTGGAPVEVVRALIPSKVYESNVLNVDTTFPIDDWLVSIENVGKAINKKTSSTARYAPYGDFQVVLPSEFVTMFEHIKVKNYIPTVSLKLDLKRIHIYCDGRGRDMWVRLFGEIGAGPIVRWQPGKPMSNNNLSEQFSIVLATILSALWHDLRCKGKQTVPRTTRKSSSGAHRGQLDPKGKKKRHRSRSKNVRRLPRYVSENDGISISGTRQWASDEEREMIKIMTHNVSGHRRTFDHVVKNRRDGAEDEAYRAAIILSPYDTWVGGYTKGVDNGDGEVETQIQSKGLATLMSFFVTDDDQGAAESK